MKIDYRLKIINEKKDFLPRKEFVNPILTSNKKIFEVTAGNGYGKTFLLNLIAYALGADKLDDKSILKSLKESLSRYNNTEDYELEYLINIDLPDSKKLILKKDFGRDKTIQFEGQPLMNPANLHQKLSLVYDVPTDPSERLNAVINDLGFWNENLRTKIERFLDHLLHLQHSITNVRDEKKIAEFERDINNGNLEIIALDAKISEQKKLNEDLLLLEELNKLTDLIRKRNDFEIDKSKKEKKFKTLKKPTNIDKKDEKIIRQLQSELTDINTRFNSLLKKLIEIIAEHKEISDAIIQDRTSSKYFENIQEISINQLVNNEDYITVVNSFIEKTDYVKDKILQFIQSEENGKKHKIHNFLIELLEQIEELIKFEADDVLEEITKNKTSFLKGEIQNKLKSYAVKDYGIVTAFLNKELGGLKGIIVDSYKKKIAIDKENKKMVNDSDNGEYYKIKGEIDNIKNKIRETESEITRITVKSAEKLNIEDYSRLESPTELSIVISNLRQKFNGLNYLDDIKSSLRELASNITAFTGEKKLITDKIGLCKTRLDIESKKSSSKYDHSEIEKIENFIKYFRIIIKNLGNFRNVINDYEKGDLSKFKDAEDIKFLNVAGGIIAYSMNNKILRQDGEYTQFSYYDMLKKEFHCDNEIRIKKDDISTGLASANYLKQRIENVEGDYVVILLDEIGNMSKNTLMEVIKSIKKIENQNRLVLSLLMQPSSDGIIINEY